MRKIVQLDEYDYNKLADLAKLNEKEIENIMTTVVLIALHISSIKITGSTFQRMYGRDLGKLSKKM